MVSKIENLKSSLKDLEDKQDKLLYKIEKRIEKRNQKRQDHYLDRSQTHQPRITMNDITRSEPHAMAPHEHTVFQAERAENERRI